MRVAVHNLVREVWAAARVLARVHEGPVAGPPPPLPRLARPCWVPQGVPAMRPRPPRRAWRPECRGARATWRVRAQHPGRDQDTRPHGHAPSPATSGTCACPVARKCSASSSTCAPAIGAFTPPTPRRCSRAHGTSATSSAILLFSSECDATSPCARSRSPRRTWRGHPWATSCARAILCARHSAASWGRAEVHTRRKEVACVLYRLADGWARFRKWRVSCTVWPTDGRGS
jgi:hypothetical protein